MKLIEKRGLSEDFLDPKYENLASPFLLPDMRNAVARIEQAIKEDKKILIYGDYDVDGVTATAILHETLRLARCNMNNVLTMLPNRFVDGYGMSEKVVSRVKAEGVQLVITVDCGSNNNEIIDELLAAEVDVVVTDHHEVMGELPKTLVVNPKRTDMAVEGELKNLCGAGVAFELARALVIKGKIPAGQEKWLLDLAMVGTICDSMELVDENRIICKFGMIVLSKTRRVGLKELMRVARVKKIDADAIGFQIGPRLNAAGRMESAELALRLLLTNSPVEATMLAEELDRLNSERKRQQQAAVAETEREITDEPVIVVSGKWHEGIVGIIAGNLTEKYKKPSFVLTEATVAPSSSSTDTVLKGSGRSFGEFDLAEAIRECRDLLVAGGGHAEACGIKLEKEKLADFTELVNKYYKSLGLKNQERFLEKQPDLRIGKIASLSLDFMNELEVLQPFGNGNPEPLILLLEVRVEFADRMGRNGEHLKLTVCDSVNKRMRLIAFGAPEEWLAVSSGQTVSVLIQPMINEWNGVSEIEGRIIKISQA
ncbi:single-stranded-DNA-specific exonuclease RecJ [Candidatus Saccharibacteria bacterium]|nr:single-stranded-DNA-specific exonuclease RecJ [Candidatus Saccharibacteria bacterium]